MGRFANVFSPLTVVDTWFAIHCHLISIAVDGLQYSLNTNNRFLAVEQRAAVADRSIGWSLIRRTPTSCLFHFRISRASILLEETWL